jgi:hypothetical protein
MTQRRIAVWLPILAALAIGCGHAGGDKMSTRESGGREPGTWPRNAPIHAKLTYLGPQEKPVGSVVLYEGEAPPDEALFRRHQSARVDYSNDDVGNLRRARISSEERPAILDNLARACPDTSVLPHRWAFVLVQTALTGERALEWLLADAECRKVVDALARSLATENELAKAMLATVPIEGTR